MSELRFDDEVVVVTGAGRGVGRSHALSFAARGARVVVADLGVQVDGSAPSSDPADEVVGEIRAHGGEAIACYGSVADEESAAAIVAAAVDTYGRIDAVVNNAGLGLGGLFADTDPGQFRTLMDVHYFGTINVTRAAWPHFVRANHGRVVNTVSEVMLGGLPGVTPYGSAKCAIFGFTRTLAVEAVAHGIAVNAIAPRAYTRMSASQADQMAANLAPPDGATANLASAMVPDQCAPAAVFLAHRTCPLNGEVLQVGLGGIARIAVVRSPGIWRSSLTAEDIAANLDEIGGIGDAQELPAVPTW
ncbi:SDR family NAD(P)-dependent oxidoreductase [Mycolicibacterium vinylchloridicum]|uniref:SDR family NAD(P)-dependent oxidoreductase n=1 Tax=Mycolicibacterium vinylchloridicum TaxID=2736928 RepID=UPI0015CCF9DB|nr:SDR family NAD(P)-dependent oxidoreductase [Mycolicibacterium vinylchloridicum]